MRRLLPIIPDFVISIVKYGLFVFPGIRSSRSQFWIRISSRISRNQHFQIASNCGGRSEITARVLYQLLYQLLIKKLEIKSETLFLSDFAMIRVFFGRNYIHQFDYHRSLFFYLLTIGNTNVYFDRFEDLRGTSTRSTYLFSFLRLKRERKT